ncbi:MAG: hypothetical protein FP816_06195 [Desulfobacteraceae bacterium]|nr:hypothetical protein [Desulfobacteraceae bacterium]MBU4001113.1 hypothetical protein [Pseudomonadota bacterium]MBU4056011.1 hypothetical protein [Pseudomonadota bacterium]
MKIFLDLSNHCIETELKAKHNRLISQYLKFKKPNEGFEEQIESLQRALENLDFGMLRTQFPDLAGNTEKKIELHITPGGELLIYANSDLLHQILFD